MLAAWGLLALAALAAAAAQTVDDAVVADVVWVVRELELRAEAAGAPDVAAHVASVLSHASVLHAVLAAPPALGDALGGAGGIEKKDAPVDAAGERERAAAQALQASAVAARAGARPQEEFGAGLTPVACAEERLYSENWYGVVPGCSPEPAGCGRALEDGVAAPEEAERLRGFAAAAMDGLFHQGGSTALVPDEGSRERLTDEGLALAQRLRDAARERVRAVFGLEAPLYDSGALLTRLVADPPLDAFEVDPGHEYWNPHVDKANIASYDYSALLYLSSGGGTDFAGGDFAFLDADAHRVVEPRAGRLLMFSSGLENLHQVREVTFGERFVLAMWFTCSQEYSVGSELGAGESEL